MRPHRAKATGRTLLYQLNHTGLFFMLPLAVTGLLGLFWHSWRLATAVALWVVPSTALYMFYYWAPVGEESVGYLRFFLTVFPGMILAGLWLLDRALNLSRAALAISLGALTFLGAAVNLANIAPQLEGSVESHSSLRTMVDIVRQQFPAGNMLFAEEGVCNQLDATGGYELYSLGLFRPGTFAQYKRMTTDRKEDDPSGLQRTRALKYMELLGNPSPDGAYTPKSAAQLDLLQADLVQQALAQRRRVGFLFRGDAPWNMLAGHQDWQLKRIISWDDPPPRPSAPGGLLTRWLRGVKVPPPPRPLLTLAQRRQQTWTLYEHRASRVMR